MKNTFEIIEKKITNSKKQLENNPTFLKESFLKLDEELGKIQNDKHISERIENFECNLQFEGLQLLRFKHICLIYKTLFNLTNDEVIYYLLNHGVFLKTYELGLLRQKIMDISGENIEKENNLSIDLENIN